MHEGPILLSSGYVVFLPPEEFDLARAADVVTELDHLLELHPHVAINLGVVTFLDSSGLSALVHARKKALSLGGDVVLFGASPRTLRLLELTQLDRVFPVYNDADSIPSWTAESAPPATA